MPRTDPLQPRQRVDIAEEVLQVGRRGVLQQGDGAMHQHRGMHGAGIFRHVGQDVLEMTRRAQARPGFAERIERGQGGKPVCILEWRPGCIGGRLGLDRVGCALVRHCGGGTVGFGKP